MKTDQIKAVLVSAIGGRAKDWRRYSKFTFRNHSEFLQKEFNNSSIEDLEYADYNQGSIPNSGICRSFVARVDDADFTAHVITSDDDSSIVYLSASGD